MFKSLVKYTGFVKLPVLKGYGLSDLKVSFFSKLVLEPLRNNLAIVLFWLGLAAVFVGAIFGKQIDGFAYVPQGTGEAVLKAGSAILGAGVFAVIMKSAQFTELFQRHIYHVFYEPDKLDGVALIDKWKTITSALLKDVLPSTHQHAVERIEKQFFDSERDYHFEALSITYDIDVSDGIATINSVTDSTLIISPSSQNPVLEQYIETNGMFWFKALRLNDTPYQDPSLFKPDPHNPNRRVMEIPLNNFAQTNGNGDKLIRMERVVQWTQNLTEDPYIKAHIKTYIKGAKIRVKVNGGYKVHFERFGLGDLPDRYYIPDDGMGFQRWQLVKSNDLLLPGQGFIMVLVPSKKRRVS